MSVKPEKVFKKYKLKIDLETLLAKKQSKETKMIRDYKNWNTNTVWKYHEELH